MRAQHEFSLARAWNVPVEVQRAGRDDVAVTFAVPIAEGARGAARGDVVKAPPLLSQPVIVSILAVAVIASLRRSPRPGEHVHAPGLEPGTET